MHYIKKCGNYKLRSKTFSKASLEVWAKAQGSYWEFFFRWLDYIWFWHYLIKQQTPPISNSMPLCSSLPSSCNIYTARTRREGVSSSYKKALSFTMPNDARCCQPPLMILLFSVVTGDQFPLHEQAQIKRIRHEKGRSKKKKKRKSSHIRRPSCFLPND